MPLICQEVCTNSIIYMNKHTNISFNFRFYSLKWGTMGTIENPLSSNRGLIFTPNNPRLPVELFLSIIESDASSQELGTPSSLLIAQALSAVDLSEIEDEVLESLQVRNFVS